MRPLRIEDAALGFYASDGRVDRTSAYNGDIAVLFVPLEARTPAETRLLLTHVDPAQIVYDNGTRNWTVIRSAAEACISDVLRRNDAAES